MAISILNYYEQPDGKNLMIMADDLYERNPGEAPDDNMPMDPTNYAISQNLGVPADGSITIVRDFDENKKVKTVANVFKDGEWKNAAEGGGGDVKVGYIEIQNSRYNPEDVIKVLEAADMVFIKLGEKIGFIYNFMTSRSEFRFKTQSTDSVIAPINDEIEDETKAKIVEILKTKFSNQISVTYT